MTITAAYVVAWLGAFAFTEIVEAPIYRRLLGVSWLSSLGASAITHPFVWFVFPRLRARWLPTTVGSELFAWLVEGAWFFLLSRRAGAAGTTVARALLVSLLANAASEGLGLSSRAWFGWP